MENQDQKKDYVVPEIEGDRYTWFYVCSECHVAINWKQEKCPCCGRRINWDE